MAVPIFNSKLDSEHVIYLDFDGRTVPGSSYWAQTYNNGEDIIAPSFSKDSDHSSFNAEELAMIADSWARVAEDFAPFNVNVTTDEAVYSATSVTNRISAVVTDDVFFGGGAGGVAYSNVFGYPHESAQPAWAFINSSGKNMAEVISHEIGHNFGLSHDGTSSVTYYSGHGSGAAGWAPIMGSGYYREVTHWSKGEYNDANNTQDDLQQIASHLGYREDDHGDDLVNASLIHLGEGLSAEGLIETNTDVDVFKIMAEGEININVSPQDVGANLDIMAVLKDINGQVLVTSNPENNLHAQLSYTALQKETVYLEISGVGNGDVASGGYSDYGSLGYYQIDV